MKNTHSTFKLISVLSLAAVVWSDALPSQAKTPAAKSPVSKAQTPPSEEQFMKVLSDKIQKEMNTHPAAVKEATQAVLLLKLDRTGKLEEVKIDQSSGDAAADQAALQAVKKSAPFGQLPVKFGDGLALKYTFRFASSQAPVPSQEDKAKSDEYMKKLREKITRSWRSPEVKSKCQTTLSFTIEKSGNIKTLSVKKSSGNKMVDEAACAAIKRAAPFEALPEIWKQGFNVDYILSAGPKNDVDRYKFNDVSLPQSDYQISRGGAKLHPLEFNKKIENKLQDRQWELEEKLQKLESKLSAVTDHKEKSELLYQKGKVLSELNKFAEAINTLEQAAALEAGADLKSARYAAIMYDLAEAYRQSNALDSACAAYQKCMDALKSSETTSGATGESLNLKDAMTGYAKTLYKQNKTKEAEQIYAEIRALK